MRETMLTRTKRRDDATALAAAAASAARPHYWIKNLLLFVPLLTAHRFEAATILPTAVGAGAFCLVASAGYIANDLLDRDHDRDHEWKGARAVASGRLPAPRAIGTAVAMAATGFVVSAMALPPVFVVLLAAYALCSLAYSAGFRSMTGVDVAALSATHAVRVFAGGAAAGIAISGWLAGFTVLVFLALALVKRVAELAALPVGGGDCSRGRPYRTRHLGALAGSAYVCVCLAAALLCAYVALQRDNGLYSSPAFLWLLCPVFAWWMLRLLSKARSGVLAGDPLVVMSRDIPTLAAGACMVAIVTTAALL